MRNSHSPYTTPVAATANPAATTTGQWLSGGKNSSGPAP